MGDHSTNGDSHYLREVSGVARRPPMMSAEDARAMILSGVSFADVLEQVDPADHRALRDWFCTSDEVTMRRRQSFALSLATAPRQAYPNGEFCKCGGLLIQDGKCKKCSGGCGYSEGSCS